MKVLVLKSNIKYPKHLRALTNSFQSHPGIFSWNVDFQDIDHVLRIEAGDHISELEIQSIVKTKGFYCLPLPD